MLGNKKAPGVAQHHENVLVDGVDMKQVMLHLADDASEHPQITSKHRGLVHQPHRMGQPTMHQNLAKALAVDRVLAKPAVHLAARVVQRPQGAGGEPLQSGGGLVEQKSFQNGAWLALVEVVARDIDHPCFFIEPGVDWLRGVGRRVEPLLDIEQQNLVELGHRLGGPVIAAHQRFAGAGCSARRCGSGMYIRSNPAVAK